MQVILKSDVDHLGYADDVVDVKRGYWRNYLRPRGLAETATTERVRELADAMERRRSVEARDAAEAKELKELVDRTSIAVPALAGPQGKLFGSVTSGDVSRVVEATRKLRIDPKKIQLDEPLKALGTFQVPVDLGHGVTAEIKVEVVESKLSEEEVARLEADQRAAEAAAEAAALKAATSSDAEASETVEADATESADADAADADADAAS
jgi:large subunit ribosomal protein L9